MIQIGHITPIPLLDQILSPEDKFHLTIAEVANSSPKYREFYQKRVQDGDYVVLDSAAFETGEATELGTMLTAAALLMPSEIVLPDKRGDAHTTLVLAERMMTLLAREQYAGALMAVPHGGDIADYVMTAQLLYKEGIRVLGLIEEIPELYQMTRRKVVDKLHRLLPEAQFHLLGIDKNLEDLIWPEDSPVRSTDTAKLVVWGLNGTWIRPGEPIPTYPGRESLGGRMGYFTYARASSGDIWAARQNIAEWR
jgi:hypothetical protein